LKTPKPAAGTHAAVHYNTFILLPLPIGNFTSSLHDNSSELEAWQRNGATVWINGTICRSLKKFYLAINAALHQEKCATIGNYFNIYLRYIVPGEWPFNRHGTPG
jgi:hypothetical protein